MDEAPRTPRAGAQAPGNDHMDSLELASTAFVIALILVVLAGPVLGPFFLVRGTKTRPSPSVQLSCGSVLSPNHPPIRADGDRVRPSNRARFERACQSSRLGMVYFGVPLFVLGTTVWVFSFCSARKRREHPRRESISVVDFEGRRHHSAHRYTPKTSPHASRRSRTT